MPVDHKEIRLLSKLISALEQVEAREDPARKWTQIRVTSRELKSLIEAEMRRQIHDLDGDGQPDSE